MNIRWIGQSGYIIRTSKTEIMIDPYLSDMVYRLEKRPRLVDAPITPEEVKADAVICTHDHMDHLDEEAIADMDKTLTFITTSEGKCKLNEMGFTKVKNLQVGETVTVGDVEIIAVYANHTTEAFGIVLKAEGYTLYFSGDTLFDERLFEVSKFQPDITFICINGKLGNMNVEEAVTTAKKIGARTNVPNHYGMFASNTENPKLFTDKLDNGFIMEFNEEYTVEQILNQAIKVPTWLRKHAIYQINLRTFSEDGTIKSAMLELPFIKDLGFRIIYLSPIFEADDSEDRTYWSERQKKFGTNNPKNTYRMKNHFLIDDEYGTLDDFKQFVKTAHDLDMKVLLDLVYLHAGPEATILKEHPEFAIQDENGQIIQNRYNFVGFDFYCSGLREYLWSNMVYWMTEGDVDGFRCDVPDAIPNDFWAEGRKRIQEIKTDAILINEGNDVSRLASTFDACYGLAWQHDLHMVLLGQKSLSDLRKGYDELFATIPSGGLMVRMLDNHDTVTNWAERSEVLLGHDGMELIQVLHYVMDGVPMVYAGNELADSAKINMFANRFYMGNYEVTDRTQKYTVASVRRQEVYKRLNSLRETCDIISHGSLTWINNSQSDKVLSFVREYQNQTLLFIGNFSKEQVKVENISHWNKGEILMEHHCDMKDETMVLDAYGYIVIKR